MCKCQKLFELLYNHTWCNHMLICSDNGVILMFNVLFNYFRSIVISHVVTYFYTNRTVSFWFRFGMPPLRWGVYGLKFNATKR